MCKQRDIIEFLNNKQQENEKRILELEALLHQNELEKQILETNKNNEIAQLTEAHQQELFSNQLTIVKYKTELEQISDFMSKREDMENQLKFLKNLLEKKEKEYKETLYNLERKVIQDKVWGIYFCSIKREGRKYLTNIKSTESH